jgi:MYXO-CTERM domain-containing protein
MIVRSSLRFGHTLPFWMAGAIAATTAGERPAHACGGCMHPPPGPTEVDGTVVTDHRMVFAISATQTVLWDQIRYSGSPSNFAWVLPVLPGARIELSQDAWIAALDASTQTVIQGPVANCYSSPPTEYDGPGPGACGGGGSNDAVAFSGADEADASAAGASSMGQVQVVSQEVVGPYQAVTVRSSQGEALGDWLRANGYDVPTAIQPTIDAFSNSGFDFIALRLAPGEGVQAMQPVRVVTAGADPSLPLRMVAAGVGANVGIELFILGEGRYHPQNFPDATVDFSQLKWDPYQQRSNYTELSAAALAANGGRGWLTESSGPANLYSPSAFNPALQATYEATCRPVTLPPPPGCGRGSEAGPEAASQGADGAGIDGADAASDGSDVASDGSEAAVDAGAGETSVPESDGGSGASCEPVVVPCDDLMLALTGIVASDFWVTRLRANLPAAALSADLVLEASASQAVLPNVHYTSAYTDPKYQPCPNSATPSGGSHSSGCACRADDEPHAHYEEAIVGALGFAAIAGIARRRRGSRSVA